MRILVNLKKLIGHGKGKEILSNISSLFSIQLINYVLPILTTPYLAYKLGVDKLGLLSFSASYIGYFTILTDYGFNYSGTRQISINKENPYKLNEIYNSVLVIKLLLFAVCFLVLTTTLFLFDVFSNYKFLYLISFSSILGNILISSWFFQGIQKMKYLTYFQILIKTFSTISIFIFIKNRDDYYFVPLLNSIGTLTVGFFSIFILYKTFKIRFYVPHIQLLKSQLVEGSHVFFSNIFISLYTISTTFILGIFTDYKSVGYFSVADKIIQIAKTLTTPISETIFPVSAAKFNESIVEGFRFIKKASWIILSLSFFGCLFIFIFSNSIITLLFGNEFVYSVVLLRIMSFIPFFVALSNILGIQIMLNINLNKSFSIILFAVSFISISLNFLFVSQYKSLGTSIIVAFSEFLVCVLMLFVIFKYVKKHAKK